MFPPSARCFSKIILQSYISFRQTTKTTCIKKASTQSAPKVTLHSHDLFHKTEVEAYNATFPTIIQAITAEFGRVPEFGDRFENVINLLLPNEKIIEGLKVVELYKAADPPQRQTPEKIRLARILGWCSDLFSCSIQVADDIIDNSETRWGKPCLHKREDVQLYAINDAMLLKHSANVVLKRFCSEYPWFTSCFSLMDFVAAQQCIGTSLDDMWKLKFELCTLEKYNLMSEYKGSYWGVLFPVMLASYCSGRYDDKLFNKARDVIRELGTFLCVQDDVVDYEHSKLDLASPNDISEGKFTWPLVRVMEMASANQKLLIRENYGKQEPKSLNIINNLYDEFNIFGLYYDYNEKSFESVCQKTKGLDIEEDHKRMFYRLIEILYERSPDVLEM